MTVSTCDGHEFLDIADMLKRLGVTRAQFSQMIKRGEVPAPLRLREAGMRPEVRRRSVWRAQDIEACSRPIRAESQRKRAPRHKMYRRPSPSTKLFARLTQPPRPEERVPLLTNTRRLPKLYGNDVDEGDPARRQNDAGH